VGADVARVRPGDHIIASFIPACGLCFYCLHDQTNLCEQMWSFSAVPRATRPDGSVATKCSVKRDAGHRIFPGARKRAFFVGDGCAN
jgi:Zn-dependent alcohol dehydrogenase